MNLVGRWRIETMDLWDRGGHLFFHLGDDSGFHAVPFDLAAARDAR